MAEVSASELTKVLTGNREAFAKFVGKYFADDYTGSHFEFFDGRGDNNETKDKFTYADVFAPNFLSRNVPAQLGYRLVEGELAEKASEVLARIPVNKSLHEYSSNPLNGEPLALWKIVLDGSDRVVTTSKLLARKRPHLLPILDSVLQVALVQGNKGRWNHYFQLFSDTNLVKELEELQGKAASLQPNFPKIAELSLLRVLDIALWMEHRPAVFGTDSEKEQHSTNCLLTYLW